MNINLNVDSAAMNPRLASAKVEAPATRTTSSAESVDAAGRTPAPTAPSVPVVEVPTSGPSVGEQPAISGPFSGGDMGSLLHHFGQIGTQYDFDGNGSVNVDDLLFMINNWQQLGETKPSQPTRPAAVDAATVAAGSTAITDVPSATKPSQPTARPTAVDAATIAAGSNTITDVPPETKPQKTFSGDDLEELLKHWGKSNSQYDFDVDGLVDVDDLLFMLDHWEPGVTPAPTTGAPRGAVDVADVASGPATEPAPPDVRTPPVISPPASETLADKLISQLRAKGFSDRPPTNIQEIIDRLELDPTERQEVLGRLREQYPQGLGIDFHV